ncbi:MAG: type I DNA topoisomerase [Candidatus Eisenbacteria bacterium]|nr:type I DNA topoisomerase [Candidatus Eisenbacteria bacterium]
MPKTPSRAPKQKGKQKEGTPLIIVESPSKARTIGKFLGGKAKVAASNGHVVDLPKSKLGVDIENNFEPEYKVITAKKKILKELKEAAGKASMVYLAPDPDREGEAIAWHLSNHLDSGRIDVRRLTLYEITRKAIEEALKNPGKIDMNKVNAQQARRVLDRIFGYKVSPFLWTTVRRGLSAGRVQSVALRLVAEREKEIAAFRVSEYWSVHGRFVTKKDEKFEAKLVKVGEGKPEFKIEAEAKDVIASLMGEKFSVAAVRKVERPKAAYPPFITSTLQQEASRRFRFSAQRTMAIAQQLYEGVELGEEGTSGLITYMRTDSTRISADAISEARRLIASQFGKDYLPDSPNFFADRSRTQGAHEAIRPTSTSRTPESVAKSLSQDQLKIYRLIWSRFVGSQMTPVRYSITTVDIAGGKAIFRTAATIKVFDGFSKVYDINEPKKEDRIPHIEEGDNLNLDQLWPEQHFTQPPPRYSEATLIKILEQKGVGRPSTYATILGTLTARDYVVKEKGNITPTELGMAVFELLLKTFPDIFEIEFTAKMEDELDGIESGKEDWVDVVRDFYEPFRKSLEEAEGKKAEFKSSVQTETDVICEKCGKKMVRKFGRRGVFLACPGYPDCKFTKPVEDESDELEKDVFCDLCGSKMAIKRGRFGRFLACTKYPDCKGTKPLSLGIRCPSEGCDGSLVEKTSKRGKVFYGCSSYPKCKFATWDKPRGAPCGECGFPLTVEKTAKDGGVMLKCPRCKAERDEEP